MSSSPQSKFIQCSFRTVQSWMEQISRDEATDQPTRLPRLAADHADLRRFACARADGAARPAPDAGAISSCTGRLWPHPRHSHSPISRFGSARPQPDDHAAANSQVHPRTSRQGCRADPVDDAPAIGAIRFVTGSYSLQSASRLAFALYVAKHSHAPGPTGRNSDPLEQIA